jgi:serine/threonine-protein kinase
MFEGEDVSDTIAAVLRAEPNWAALPADTPAAVRTVIERCLVKDRRQRFADISIAHFLLTERGAMGATGNVIAPPLPVRSRSLWRRAVPYAAATVATAIVVGYPAWMPRAAPPLPVTRFEVTLGADDQFTNTGRHLVALSPDGTRVAYVANLRLYLRAFDQLDAAAIGGTDGGGLASPRSPFFSPDGQWIGFWSDNQLKKVSVTRGAPVTVTGAQNLFGASWGPDDTIVYGQGSRGIWRVSGNGGTPENIIEVTAGQLGHGPQMLPGGRAVLFTLAQGAGNWDEADVVVQTLDSGARQILIKGGTDARYVPTGHLVYALRGALFAVPFDPDASAVAGGPVPVVDGVRQTNITGAAHYSVSGNGALVYVHGTDGSGFGTRTLVWVDRTGVETPIPAPSRAYQYPRLSPDGTRVALDIPEQNRDIWLWDFARTTLTRLTFDPTADQHPVWTPDGRRLLFSSMRRGGLPNLYWQLADGTGSVERLSESPNLQFATGVTPDGARAIVSEEQSNLPNAT